MMKTVAPGSKTQVLRSEKKLRREYIEILRRCHENHGSIPIRDRDHLTYLMQSLEISKDTLRRDYKVVHHVEKLKANGADVDKARKCYDEAFRALEAFRERVRRRNDGRRHLEEQNRLDEEYQQASEDLTAAKAAQKELDDLHRKYPALFRG
jgi:predicted  nucleic acid-binding Zn-ribbon protein